MPSKSGFTVVELTVTIALIALLSAVAIPNIIAWIPDRNLSRAAGDLMGNLQKARSHAIKSYSDCQINFYNDPDRYEIPDLGVTVVLSDYRSGVEFYDSQNGSITFNPQGLCKANVRGIDDPIRVTNVKQERCFDIKATVAGGTSMAKNPCS